ncbi:hypothetical protein LMG28688_01563 [Paraburkholderia caffeinitolerans]|uniref:ASCH domain-containing protein n=1 Tax=Paraburkholderia caffeinitolerans TaxID=1723730 RepID=A0A6J5FRS8_9BURK|nr:ASCH domain-containing protein [Paraburkholderia caffeinitolerans]CAB3783025.1 hypothetical protein LMG28688_01563 [Paraburkholderia caffeinitolerans]
MKALSIRQPWAWLIIRPDLTGAARVAAIEACDLKDIENRTWPTRLRGRFLIHASKGMTRAEYDDVEAFLDYFEIDIALPGQGKLDRGGIVGAATITDCIPSARRNSRWHMDGQWGFRLENVKPVPFVECKGALQFFDVPEDIATQLRQMHELGAIA